MTILEKIEALLAGEILTTGSHYYVVKDNKIHYWNFKELKWSLNPSSFSSNFYNDLEIYRPPEVLGTLDDVAKALKGGKFLYRHELKRYYSSIGGILKQSDDTRYWTTVHDQKILHELFTGGLIGTTIYDPDVTIIPNPNEEGAKNE